MSKEKFKQLFIQHNSDKGKYTVMIPNHNGHEPLLRTDNFAIAMRMCSLSCESFDFDDDVLLRTYVVFTDDPNEIIYSCVKYFKEEI